jgi:hypothetical protein
MSLSPKVRETDAFIHRGCDFNGMNVHNKRSINHRNTSKIVNLHIFEAGSQLCGFGSCISVSS